MDAPTNPLIIISSILIFLTPLAALVLAVVALSSLRLFGGARRNTLSLLATGVFCVVIGGFYLYGVASSYFAIQDNAYLGNYLVGLALLFAGGCVLLPAGLAAAGLNRWVALALAVASLIGLVEAYHSQGLTSTTGGNGIAIYVVALLVVVVIALLAQGRADLLGEALGLGALAALVAFVVFVSIGALQGNANLSAYLHLGMSQSEADKPPVLEGFGAAITVLIGVALFIFARGGSHGAAASRSAPSGA